MAVTVVIIAIKSILLTSSLFLDDLQYQNAPSTATPIIIGTAMASTIEMLNPNEESIPISAKIINPTLPIVIDEILQSLNPSVSIAIRKINDGINNPERSSSAIFCDLANNIFTPAGVI